MILEDFSSLNYKKINFQNLHSLIDQYPSNFDCIEKIESSQGETKISNYSLNLYESQHYEIIHSLVDKWWLDDITQITIGCYIHDNQLYNQFLKYCFPNKVKDLKIIHYKHMGRCSKIWNNMNFQKIASCATNEVRIC